MHSELKERLANLPNKPGVYQMLGKNGRILYVGKAKSLKARVMSYFRKQTHPKTCALVARICDVRILLVSNETEALLLEQTLIKTHKPPYNVVLRDDKSYVYLHLTEHPYPRLTLARGRIQTKEGRFFGPYPVASQAREVESLLHEVFLLRSCSDAVFYGRKRPCLEYQIKRCSAPCCGYIDQATYQESALRAIGFLSGDAKDVQAHLVHKMEHLAGQMRFLEAAQVRDRLSALQGTLATQAVDVHGKDADVFAVAMGFGVTLVHVLTVRGGRVLGGREYPIEMIEGEDVLTHFLFSFYSQISTPPAEIILPYLPKEDVQGWCLAQFGKQPDIKTQVRGYRKSWQELALMNATFALKSHRPTPARHGQLEALLGMLIDEMECFDISHTLGEATMASCVVFDQSGPKKRAYRLYRISCNTGDDYAAMREVLTRRYQKHPLPSLVVVDGGKGQLNSAFEALTALGCEMQDTLLMGIAKGEGRKAGFEVLHFLDRAPMDLPSDHPALHLLMHIRDEAHRFALKAHRRRRHKTRTSSVLEAIEGLGPVKRRALLGHFGGMRALLGASETDLHQVPGIGTHLARVIYQTLHG